MLSRLFLALGLILSLLQPAFAGKAGNKALLNATAEGDLKAVKALTKSAKSINSKDEAGNTLLMLAASNGHSKVAKYLLDKKADINVRNQEEQTALYMALVNDNAETAKDLIAKGADLNDLNGDNQSALLVASSTNQTEVMDIVLKKAPELLEKADNRGMTPLLEAARFGSTKTVEILLKAGANKKATNKDGKTALDLATKAQNEAVAKLLK